MNTQNVHILEDRGILYINGVDAKEFLQNMISNDINKVNEDNSSFASLLSPHEDLIVMQKNYCLH